MMISPLQLLDDLSAENISTERAIERYGAPLNLFYIVSHLQIDNMIEIYKTSEGKRIPVENWEIQEVLRLLENKLEYRFKISGMMIYITELGVRCIS